MSDKPGRASIPAWQRGPVTSPPPSTTDEIAKSESQPEQPAEPGAEESTKEEASSDKTTLHDQAARFLQDPSIRDAPRDKKVAFLQSKGVKAEDIDTLLGTSQQDSTLDISKEAEKAWSTPAKPPAPKPQPRDIPPIVTYPEFLTQSEKPPPLVTTRRLLNTAYIAGGLAASIYGLSKYIIKPMTENLAEVRHDFASHTQEQLEDLNGRLGKIVSEDPETRKGVLIKSDVADDISETDSDPTELFHRDYGTQTTPSLSRRPSNADSAEASQTPSVVAGHENRLKILTSHLRELEATRSNDSASSESLKTRLNDLTMYLNEMSYQNQYYTGMGSLYGSNNYGMSKSKDGKDDQVEALKADIRAVKGVLLSARNFPAGGGRATGRISG